MTIHYKTVLGTFFAIAAIVFFGNARPAHGQVAQSETIQMTNVLATVDKAVDTKKAKAGDSFNAKVVTGTTLNDGTNVPAGSVLEGRVDSATPSEHKSDGTLVVTIDKLQIKGGKEIPVKATVMSVATFEKPLGTDKGGPQDRAFDTSARDSARMNGASDAESGDAGPHPVPGLTLSGSVKDPTSGTFTQAKGNVHLSNENQIQMSLAVVPAGIKMQ